MQFLSIKFALFFLIVICFMLVLKKESHRQLMLLLASYGFYCCWDYRFLILIIFQSVVVYFCALKNKRAYKIAGVFLTLCVLGFFKYYNFFVESFCTFLGISKAGTLNIVLPVGISFYTFQALSYIFDVYNGKVKAEKSFINVALYIGFFPQLMSGPIVKSYNFLPQLKCEHKIKKENIASGIQIFIFGVIKKVVIADRLGVCVDAVYSAPLAYSGLSVLAAALTYSMQIYCDFSGYSDMAIGIARILDFDLGINFNSPYIAKNPSEFWRRWHISLSQWFKEYVYFPLGGSRGTKMRTYINLVLVMLLSGLWHGAGWTFILWGGLYGIASALNRVISDIRNKYNIHIKGRKCALFYNGGAIIINFAFVTLCWIVFRAESIDTAFVIIKRIFTMAEGINYIYIYSVIYGLVILAGHLYVLVKGGESQYINMDLTKFKGMFVLCFFIILCVVLRYGGNTAFIYSQF